MVNIAKKHGFQHKNSEFRHGNYGPNSVKDVHMEHPSGHKLKITTFYHSPHDINHHLAGQGVWSLEHARNGIGAFGHDPKHLHHELGKLSGMKEAQVYKIPNQFRQASPSAMKPATPAKPMTATGVTHPSTPTSPTPIKTPTPPPAPHASSPFSQARKMPSYTELLKRKTANQGNPVS